jgi:BASS family bile acid:Na+ symporter
VVGVGFALVAGTDTPIQVSTQEMVITLVSSTAVPVLIGMGILRWRPAMAEKVRGKLLGLATVVMVLLLIGLFVNTARIQPDVAGMFARSSAAVVLLIGSCALVAAAAARLAGLSWQQENTLVLEVGIQNINLALVVAINFLQDTQYLGPALVYLPFMFVLAGVVVYRGRRRDD